jgi:hypothetical protein
MSLAARTPLAAGLLAGTLLAAGCGGQPSVVPAGTAGMDVPYDDAAGPALPGKPDASTSPVAAGSTPPPAIPLPGSTFAAPKPAKTTKGKTTTPVTVVTPPQGGLALPQLGAYSYALTGTSSLGKPPATMQASIASAGGADEQIWTLDARRDDGAGIIEELTLGRQDAGIYMSAYRLDASTGIAAVVLEFAPASPVLLEPDAVKAGQPWSFDLESKDGCVSAHTDGVLVAEPKPGAGTAAMRHVRLTTTLKTIGPPTCPAVTAKRVQDLYHASGVALPARMDSDLSGTLGAVPVKANTQAILTSPTPKSVAREPETD